jgi:hypothetical protein
MIKPLLKLRRRRVSRTERWIVPMKRGFDITHGWLKTGFFARTSLQPAEYGKKPGFFGFDA